LSSQMKIPAKKRFGQHFLRDTGTLNRIVRLIEPAPDDLVIEVGAGDGALSARLAPLASRLLAIEIDPDCLSRLEANLSQFPAVKIVPADVLSINIEELVAAEIKPAQNLRVVGNLPYNIATRVIERFLHCKPAISQMVFMVQLEVAERIVASPGSRQYGYLSVACQRFAAVRMHFKVSPSCFVPRPKVTSAVISLCPHQSIRNENFERHFEELVKAGFSHRRKTLANSLRRHHKIGPHAGRILADAAIDPSRRAEDLSIAEYEKLTSFWLHTFSASETEPATTINHGE
jgi:16S rRNA (adenine1518-N6/adenine1519-N6)-dimethyltransferase